VCAPQTACKQLNILIYVLVPSIHAMLHMLFSRGGSKTMREENRDKISNPMESWRHTLLSRLMINVVVVHLPDLDRGRNAAAVFHLLHTGDPKSFEKKRSWRTPRATIALGMTTPRNTCIESSERNTGPTARRQTPKIKIKKADEATDHQRRSVPVVCQRTMK
jgi:hypothetical protein